MISNSYTIIETATGSTRTRFGPTAIVAPHSPFALAILTTLALFHGTGGAPVPNTSYEATSPTLQIINRNRGSQKSIAHILSLPEKLAKIQVTLGVSVTDMARIFNVQRPAIYSWITDKVAPHSGNNEKIQRIYELSKKWNVLSTVSPNKYLNQATSSGLTLLDILELHSDNDSLIDKAFKEIKLSQDLAFNNQKVSVAEIAEKEGFVKVPAGYPRSLFKRA